MEGKVILPGILDGHVHLQQLGNALGRVNCLRLSAAEIQAALLARQKSDPDAEMYLGASFLFDAIGQPPHRKILDEIIPDVPVFIDSMDLHSCWTNSKGLEVLGITKDSANPKGGEFQRDENGELTGLLMEMAFHDYVWPWIADKTSLEEAVAQLDVAFKAFQSTGVTGAVDMAIVPESLAALEEYYKRNGNTLPIRMTMHWLVPPAGSDADREARVRKAAEHKERLKDHAPWMRLAGIKIISDGVVDSCTAYMKSPYSNGAEPGPIWPADELTKVITLADSLGLQIACHALGDAASEQALDAFEAAIKTNGPRERRNRIEHLEVVTPESIRRLTDLGIVASLQPLHADPVYAGNWHDQLDHKHACRAFPLSEFTEAGSRISLGTDAPVAPHHALPNLYSATTRKSQIDPTLVTTDPRLLEVEKFVFPLEDSIRHYTAGTAWSIWGDDKYGVLEAGKSADFCVLAIDPFKDGLETLKQAQQGVLETWLGGDKVWSA
jgi:predicted amidohydrolase YtcJ